MIQFESEIKKLAKYMYFVAGAAIIAMMLLSTADVVLRLGGPLYSKHELWIFSFFQPIPGTYELVSFLGAVAASFAMAHTSIEGGHVSVSLLVRLFSKKNRVIVQFITNSLALVLFALISWRSIIYAEKLRSFGEVSMTLQLPYYPFIYGVAFSAFAVCLVLLTYLFNDVSELYKK